MKNRILMVVALSFTMIGFAQKNEIKAAEKALKGGDSAAAKTSLEAVSGMISGADEKIQAQYHFTRGKIYSDLAKKGDNSAFEQAVESFQKVLDIESKTGKEKYTSDTKQYITSLRADLINAAVSDQNEKAYILAAEKLMMAYRISPLDTSFLYYAANNAMNGGEYELALESFNRLNDMNYDGSTILYKATNVATNEIEQMDKVQRDLMVKSGSYKDPIDEKTPSVKGEIIVNQAKIYSQLGQDEKAIEAFTIARERNPNDINLLISEANLHFKQGNKSMFKELMTRGIEISPDNPDLYYNLGTVELEEKNIDSSRDAFKKAIELDSNYTNAFMNLAYTYTEEGNGLIEEMNSLGNSRADIARYEELKQQKDDLFSQGALVLEDALKVNNENQAILTQLKNIYYSLGDDENFMRVKKLLGE